MLLRLVNIIVLISSSLRMASAIPLIIVGAGPAGIAAATKLLENNFTDFKILEAERRIGGRIHSVKLGDSYVDMGAEWCHGEENNIVFQTVKNMNLLESLEFTAKIYMSSSQSLDDKFAKELMDLCSLCSDPPKEDIHPTRYITYGEFCTDNFTRTIYEKYSHSPEKLKIAKNAMDLAIFYVLSLEGAFSWYDSILNSDGVLCEGDTSLKWKDKGYRIYLDVMMKKYPEPSKQLPIDDKILLEKEVTKIYWNSGRVRDNINVICTDNSRYSADHVIFTPSVGVLKEKGSSMFIPRLPYEKLRSIEDIGFGSVMKIILYFSEALWYDTPDFLFLWTDEDKQAVIHEFPEGPTWNGQSWLTFMHAAVRPGYNPNVLTIWLTGNLIPAIEILPEDLLMRGAHFTLKKFLGRDYDVPMPKKIMSSKWYSNPHFRGTYSFQTIHSRKPNKRTSAEEDLAVPLRNFQGKPIVQFAGEASHPIYFGNVHGAVETGYREADIFLNSYK